MKHLTSLVVVLFLTTILAFNGCTTPGKRTGIGAGAGAATGAAIGGAGAGWKGAAIGAAAGAATGALIGNYLDKQYKELDKVADTKKLKDALLVDLKNDLLFDTDSAQVRQEARTQLVEVGKILAKYEHNRVRVEGYTDNVGPATYNKALSQKRAEAVEAILREQGVDPKQTMVQGFGETNPTASNSTPGGRSKNRRVQLLIDVPQKNAAAVRKEERARAPASK